MAGCRYGWHWIYLVSDLTSYRDFRVLEAKMGLKMGKIREHLMKVEINFMVHLSFSQFAPTYEKFRALG